MTTILSGEPPYEQFQNDVQVVNSCDTDVLSSFCDLVSKFGEQTTNVYEKVAGFAKDHGLPQQDVIMPLLRWILCVFVTAARINASANALYEEIVGIGIPEDSSKIICKAYHVSDIRTSNFFNISTFMINKLVDLEWRFGITASSSELSEIGNMYLQLKFVLEKGKNETENIFIELTLPQFYSFLHEIEKAKASIDVLE